MLKHLPPKQRSLVEVHVQDEGARRELQQGDDVCFLVVVMSLTVAGAEQAKTTAAVDSGWLITSIQGGLLVQYLLWKQKLIQL